MKKELRRYSLVEYLGKVERIVKTESDYLQILESIKKNNRKSSSKRFFGNVTKKYIADEIHVEVHVYNRLTPKMTISDIEKLTSSFDERELIGYFGNRLKTKNDYIPDINVAYFEDKNSKLKNENDLDIRILYLPIIYMEDVKYLDIKYIKRCLLYHAESKDLDFFKDLAYRFETYLSSKDEIEKLYETIEKVEYYGLSTNHLYFEAKNLLNKLIYERDKNDSLIRLDDGSYQLSQRRLRDFGMFIKYYNNPNRNSPLEYNGYLIKDKIDREEFEQRCENEEDSRREYLALRRWDSFN